MRRECVDLGSHVYMKKINPEILPQLQKGAFDTGVDVDSVLFVGSLYLRDLALPKFNCRLEDIPGR